MRVAALAAGALILSCCAAAGSSARPAAGTAPGFDHVGVIVFENKERPSVLGSGAAPTFDRLARRYADLPRYEAVSHPSLPNYLALVSGRTWGIHSDCTDCVVRGRSLADSLDAAGRSWRSYVEGYPSSSLYAKKHNPFLYFLRVVVSPDRRRRVVPLSRLGRDLAGGRLPDFALVVPDLCHDMHNCSVAVGDAWLARFVPPLLRLPRTAVFIVFDEGTSYAGGGGLVPALVAGTAVRRGSTVRGRITHYGLLRTIEDAWHLPRLGLSARARPITGIWR